MPKSSNEERKKKISNTLKEMYKSGMRINYFNGKSFRKGVKLTEDQKKAIGNFHRGKKISNETRIKMALSHKKGKEHYNWKGGFSITNRNRYVEVNYKIWRSSVFERDKYTCRICGASGVYLEAHHILSWINYPAERYKINNGMTLCKGCHKMQHRRK